MKYRTLYQMLDRRRADNLNFRYTDYSGWRERPQTYLSRSRPLWIIAEDQGILTTASNNGIKCRKMACR